MRAQPGHLWDSRGGRRRPGEGQGEILNGSPDEASEAGGAEDCLPEIFQ